MAKRSGSFMPSFGVGAVALNSCASTDTSYFCQFQRFFQVFMQILILVVVLYFIYSLATAYFSKGSKGLKNFF